MASLRNYLLGFTTLAFVALFAYVGVFHSKFSLWDDKKFIIDNPLLSSTNLKDLVSYWHHPLRYGTIYDMYVPLTHTVWWLTYQASKKQDSPSSDFHPQSKYFHSLNFSIHLLNSFLVWIFLVKFLDRNRKFSAHLYGPLFGALFFLLHPIQVEPVAWISATKDLLSAFFGFGSLVFFLYFEKTSMQPQKKIFYIAMIISFLLALLSKPSSVVFPVFMVILGGNLLQLTPLLLMCVPTIFLNIFIQNQKIAAFSPLLHRPFIVLDSIFFYVNKIFLPLNLGVNYSRHTGDVFQRHDWLYGMFVLLAFFALVLYGKKMRRILLTAVMFFLVGVGPVLGLLTFQYQSISTVADHYLYVSLLGPALLVAYFIHVYPSRWLTLAILACLTSYFFLTKAQVKTWADDVTLFEHGIKISPNSVPVNVNLGAAYQWRGMKSEAIFYFEKALALDDKNSRALINLGKIYRSLGEHEKATEYFSRAHELYPGIPLSNFGVSE